MEGRLIEVRLYIQFGHESIVLLMLPNHEHPL
jgi:hypothetical protein